ncbi:hypothetical protein QTH87_24465 [Variovorax sp. J22P168]|uniref:G8 domain-containing protein n=1 Tax=Variovorax jilinensis TaxID=3053513 RepID=UPI0025779E70|nr:G8 domain-containing protein [Variovorax sp. J22P168]MDM0015614.1 hypothetical protein [Variovorax sp. J22P168]
MSTLLRAGGVNMIDFFKGSLALATLCLAACGGSDGANIPLLASAGGVPAVCASAFDGPAGSSEKGALSTHAKEGDEVGLSSCLDAQRNVTIGGAGGCGPTVVIDRSFTGADALGKITIAANGKLAAPQNGEVLEIETTGIAVAGVLSLGTAACPIGGDNNPTQRVRITFTGSQTSQDPTAMGSGADKGIELQAGGILRLFGAKGVAPKGVSWTYLSQPAGPAAYQTTQEKIGAPVAEGGQRRLHLAADVTQGSAGWKAGDWIVVATSSFSPFESEFVQIQSIEPAGGGSVVTLVQPLRHYHFGGADPGLPSEANFGADARTNYGVDERSEVGLVSRSITFTARTASATDDPKNQNHHWGGEIRLLPGFAEASIQGVELEKFGKARNGSYPIHFHMTGQAGPHLIDSNSIHHSYNKCVTVHMSQGVKVSNNVCARAVGHLFYQEMAQEQGGQFIGNLGIGAMSNSFGIAKTSRRTADDLDYLNFWEGDYLAKQNGYHGLNLPNTDNQLNPSHGRCFVRDPNRSGALTAARPTSQIPGAPPCIGDEFYMEQSSGFWIGNPGTVLKGNSIAGCQGLGKGYWYVPPANGNQKFEEVGEFRNNRVHGCYDGLFGETDIAAVSEQLFPTLGGKPTAEAETLNVIAHFHGFTATRIRNRGVWMRPAWTAVEGGRFATNRDSVSLVSSGGNDGNSPGVWALLKDSVLVGLSTNNVDRWGPCARHDLGEGEGCVDLNPEANELLEKGYQTPRWNSAGYMIYDGPVRILRNHFVNYLKDIKPLLTNDDTTLLGKFVAWPDPTAGVYEGDAALGWFQNNQSAYPTASTSRALSFDNVDLRHQIYTEKVNQGDFRDGDMNTALIDLDGTLTGYVVVDANGVRVSDEFPISLNNLPFNRAGNSVDECLATGPQDEKFEGRATSLISAANMATLEFEGQDPTGPIWQNMEFTKDSMDAGVHQRMSLMSRNRQGIWEPKVASGYGYTVRAVPTTAPGQAKVTPGMPAIVRLGFTDAVKPAMDTKPFYTRLGICYSNPNGSPPSGANIKVVRGYKSWGGGSVSFDNALLQQYFNRLVDRRGGQHCHNLDDQGGKANLNPVTGCPAEGVTAMPAGGVCPAGSSAEGDGTKRVCVFPREQLTAVGSLAALTNADGTPANGGRNFFFDAQTGMLFLYVQQASPNAHGPSPLGSCRGLPGDDPACPGKDELDTYYSCPPQGCINYSVELNDPNYVPGPANCEALAGGNLYGPNGYSLPEPPLGNRLGLVVTSGPSPIVEPRADPVVRDGKTYQRWLSNKESCPITQPPVRATPVAALGAKREASTPGVAQWLRDGLATGTTAASRWSGEWFSARRAPAPQIDPMAQICMAKPA